MTESPITPPKSENAQPDDGKKQTTSKPNAIWRFVSERLLNLATLVTFFSVAGYFVVHSYLDKITGIFTYHVEPAVYISAGVNMELGVIGGLLSRILPTQISTLLASLISLLVVLGIALILYWTEYKRTRSPQLAKERMDSTLKRLQRLNFYLFLVSVAILAALLGFVYGYSGYEYSPRAIGGGMPTTVVLVFKPASAEDVAAMALPISMNPNARLQSAPVTLLMELSDGVLVRDPQQGIPIVIKNDLLYALVDASTRAVSPSSTRIPSVPTETPTLAPTPTT